MEEKIDIPEYYTKYYGKGGGHIHLYKILINFVKEPILDLGCGTGGWIKYLSKKGIKDITPVDFYCKNMRDHPNFIELDLNKFPYNIEKKYKTISILSTIFYLDSPIRTLNEVHRLLDKDGRLLINFASDFRFYEKKYKCKVPYILPKKSAEHLLETAGFRIIKSYRNLYLGFVPGISLRHNWFVCEKRSI